MMTRPFVAATIAALLILASATVSQACGRCGFSRCRYVSPVKVVHSPPIIKEKLVQVPVDQSNKSINVTYNIQVAEPAAREGLTSYRTYADYYSPLNFDFDAWRQGAQQYQSLAASHAEASDARVATVVEGIARIKGSHLNEQVQLERLKLANRILDGDDNALETYLRINERSDSSTTVEYGGNGNGGGNVGGNAGGGLALFQRDNCLKCHSGDAPKADLDLSDVNVIRANGERILKAVMEGKMPLDDQNRPVDLGWQAKAEWAQSFASQSQPAARNDDDLEVGPPPK